MRMRNGAVVRAAERAHACALYCHHLDVFGFPCMSQSCHTGPGVAAAAGQLMAQSRAAVTTGSQLMVTDFTGNTSLRDLGAKCAVFIQHPVLAMLSFVHNFPS